MHEIEGLLAAWRDAAREWERHTPASREATGNLARAWLAYQIAVGAVGKDEIVLLADDDGCYVAASAAAARFFGVTMDRLLRMTVADVTPPSARTTILHRFRAFLADGRSEGDYDAWLPTGELVRTRFAATANNPVPGLHISRLTPAAGTSDATLSRASADMLPSRSATS